MRGLHRGILEFSECCSARAIAIGQTKTRSKLGDGFANLLLQRSSRANLKRQLSPIKAYIES